MSVLRPELYERLVQRFGKVIVASAGEKMVATVVTDSTTGRPRLNIVHSGEYYRVACCYCSDTRHRLWINHRWGLYVPALKSKNLWLASCHHEDCLRQSGKARKLYDLVFDDFGYHDIKDLLIVGNAPPTTPSSVEAPGELVPLSQLIADHSASAYLRGRGFDPADLHHRYHVCYCVQAKPEYPSVTGRIVAPVYMHHKLVGWQARHVGEVPGKHIPKYFTKPGFAKGSVLYNFDVARQYPYVVVTEGVTDVWKVGPRAVALFGKTATITQTHLLATVWGTGVVIILLDADAQTESRQLEQKLNGLVKHVARVQLPEGVDPGQCDGVFLWEAIRATVEAKGIDPQTLISGLVIGEPEK